MTFPRPTLPEIRERVLTDLGPAAALRRSPERALGTAIAAESHLLHGHLSWAARQANPRDCDADQLGAWATTFGVPRKQPTKAVRKATFTGTNGTSLPTSTVMQLADGTRYVVTTGGTVALGEVEVTIEAEETGTDANADDGAIVRLTTPISGIESDGEIVEDNDTSDGTDLEDVEAWRARLLSRLEEPPTGGGSGDYKAWIKATPTVSVAEAYVFPGLDGAGTVGLSFTVTGDDPIPDSGQVTDVQTYVDERRPVDVLGCTVFAPIAQPVTYSIQLDPNDATTQAAVIAALKDLHRREATPGGTLLLSHIREAISSAAGETDHVLVAPAANVAASSSQHLPTYSAPSFAAIP